MPYNGPPPKRQTYAMVFRDGMPLVCICGNCTLQPYHGHLGAILVQCERCGECHHPMLMPVKRPPKCTCCDDVSIVVSSIEVSGYPPEDCDE